MLVTKRTLCQSVVNDWKLQNGNRDPEDRDITSSSSLAVAMEHLGLITNDGLKTYASSRGGVLSFGSILSTTLSLREIIESLPD